MVALLVTATVAATVVLVVVLGWLIDRSA